MLRSKKEVSPASLILQKKRYPSWMYSVLVLQVLFAGVGWVLFFMSFLAGGFGILFIALGVLLQGCLISLLITLAVREKIYWLLLLELVIVFSPLVPLLKDRF